VPGKIFISYRRQDSGANALGIGQYLENEFGRKNVFIDVDMRAGAKFPKVLEQRLAECKVMLVLIGPEWLNAKDEHGQRRLDDPDDWVRLEISHALNRNIIVIPVRVNGAELPTKAKLPDDMRGLLDHQAVSVTLAGFRNEMAGLVRDIRSISGSRPWRRFGAIASGLLLLSLTAVVFIQYPNSIEQIRSVILSAMSGSVKPNDVWDTKPGEWVWYGTVGTGGVQYTHHFRPASIKFFGDRVSFEQRYALQPAATSVAPANTNFEGAYEEAINVLDCRRSTTLMSEKITYSSTREVISRFKWDDPETLDLANGLPIPPGSVLKTAQILMCDEKLKPLLSKEQMPGANMKFLARLRTGDGDTFYGEATQTSDPDYASELLTVLRYDADHQLTEQFPPGTTVIGIPRAGARTRADRMQFNCKDRKVRDPRWEYYDSKNNLLYAMALFTVEPIVATPTSLYEKLIDIVCGPKVQGTYEGTNRVTTAKGAVGEYKVSVVVEQVDSAVSLSFATAAGHFGNGTGQLKGSVVDPMSLQSTTPGCPGSFLGSLKFEDGTLSWTLKGEDCGGPLEAKGIAKRTKL
jgi:hypothetical protein